MTGRQSGRTLGDLLAFRRQRHLIGRAAEREIFRAALANPDARVLFVYGPGGIGKTSLLDIFADASDQPGLDMRRMEGHTVPPTPQAVLDAIGTLPPAGRLVLLVDTYERLAQLDDWFRIVLFPTLPGNTVAVLAGRTPPDAAWLADPAWREVLSVISLRNLAPKECHEYLQECGIAAAAHEGLIDVTHGHPLGLSLLSEVVARGGESDADPLSPNLVAVLLRRLLDVVPSTEQRRALGVCTLMRVTTEPALRAALAVDDAHEQFDWLRGLSFVESGPHGLMPHELARDVLDADLHWRDPDAYTTTFRRVSTHLIDRMKTTSGPEQIEAVLDAKFMHRHQRVSQAWADWDSFGRYYPEPARPTDHAGIVELVEMWEGQDAAAIAERWLHRQPGGFAVVRQPNGDLRGALAQLELTAANPNDLAADPAATLAWEYAQRHTPARPGEQVTLNRFIIDRECYQHPSPTMNLAPVLSILQYLRTPGLCLDLITLADPDRWAEYLGFFEIRYVPGVGFALGGRPFGIFARDFRRIPLDPWLRLMFERDLLGGHAAVPAPASLSVVVLSEADFAHSVRQALRDLRRRARLVASPLVRSRLVLGQIGEGAAVDVLAGLLREAAEGLRHDPRDEKLFRVVDRTFLRPAASQEKAAEVLDLPLSTYKRHLKSAVDRLVADLWQRELGSN